MVSFTVYEIQLPQKCSESLGLALELVSFCKMHYSWDKKVLIFLLVVVRFSFCACKFLVCWYNALHAGLLMSDYFLSELVISF